MQSILVDTSVWSEHFRNPQQLLISLLNENLVISHEFIVAELALSLAADHQHVLADIAGLGLLPTVSLDEYLLFVRTHAIVGKRIGCVDTHLLASCKLGGAGLLTLDKHLAAAAHTCDIEVLPADALFAEEPPTKELPAGVLPADALFAEEPPTKELPAD